MNYPKEWNQLPKHERKKKIKILKKRQQKKNTFLKKLKNYSITIVILFALFVGYKQLTNKTPEEIVFEQKIKIASLDDKVEEFPIEGRDHIAIEVEVEYQTNPPTSGGHLSEAEKWGVYHKEINDKAAVHGLEHGGVWISYKNIDDVIVEKLEQIGKNNSQSVIVSPRKKNDDNIVITSWGKMMRLESIDEALIQKYIDTYKNNSPEQLAR